MITRIGTLIIVAFIASMFLIVYSANAQTVCGARASLLKQLEDNYKESPISMGLSSNGSIVELTKSDKGTWTILLTTPKGVTCLIAVGKYWEILKQDKTGYVPL
ncbi:MAG: hypothetical protein KAJ10_11370 [Thermodesulfovibrionia bacterium]|nr:hypothetical protein [Thermodesulfovibrionia bacterium]